MLSDRAPQLIAARNRLEELSNNFDVRKLAARMEDNKEDYYILCGWMAEDDVEKFLKEVNANLESDGAFKEAYDYVMLNMPEKAIDSIDKFLKTNSKVWNGF